MSDAQDVSVVIPAYNAGNTIAAAIASTQHLDDVELIVVDDGSTDDTASVCEQLGARVIRQANSGANVARESGLASCTRDFVIFLDADDQLLPEIGLCVQRLRTSPDTAIVGGNYMFQGRKLRPAPAPYEDLSTTGLLNAAYSPWPPAASVWNRAMLKKAQALPIEQIRPRLAEDYELLIRASLVGRVEKIDQATCAYAQSGGKSAVHAEEDVFASERIRLYYAEQCQIPIVAKTDRQVKQTAALRRTKSVRAASNPARTFVWLVRHPRHSLHLTDAIIHKISTNLRIRRTKQAMS